MTGRDMANERLRSTLLASGYSERQLAEELGIDAKSIQRWITQGRVPHRTTAFRTAKLLGVAPGWLWPSLEDGREAVSESEVVTFYPHRSDVPRHLWLDVLRAAKREIVLMAYASLFLAEDNPEAIRILKQKSREGVSIRIALGDPDSPEAALRGAEERLYEAIPGRIKMAIAYYRPLFELPGIEFRLHRTTLYNSIFKFDDQMLINQHAYGVYGYLAPILHLRRIEGGDLFDMYGQSFERVWEVSYPPGSIDGTANLAPNQPTSSP
jgi:transcriptional regulator with XRE-family HTH domain